MKARCWNLLFSAALVICSGCKGQPLGEAPRLEFEQGGDPQREIEIFLQDDFRVINRLSDLPRPVLHAFTKEGGSRLVIVNPGKRFEETDAIDDATLPNKRLIFAGMFRDKCFVHYEEGGIARFGALALFRLKPSESLQPVRHTFCGPAANLQDLRSQVAKGLCSHSLPQGMR